jgi:hypothetical protein
LHQTHPVDSAKELFLLLSWSFQKKFILCDTSNNIYFFLLALSSPSTYCDGQAE